MSEIGDSWLLVLFVKYSLVNVNIYIDILASVDNVDFVLLKCNLRIIRGNYSNNI